MKLTAIDGISLSLSPNSAMVLLSEGPLPSTTTLLPGFAARAGAVTRRDCKAIFTMDFIDLPASDIVSETFFIIDVGT